MEERPCPYCGERRSTRYGTRGDAVFARCAACGSIHRDLTQEAFSRLHEVAFADDEFASRVESALGGQPDTRTWAEVLRAVGTSRSVLEVGPGTGHLLAAAKADGRAVAGVETSAVHRDMMERLWGITTYPSFEAVPAGTTYDTIVAINVIEHVYDVASFLRAIAGLMAVGGRCFISTVNARALTGTLCGTRWAMYKQVDHVSFPSAEGFRAAGRRAGLVPVRVWSRELPFETPISVAVAMRDALRGEVWGGAAVEGVTTRPANPSHVGATRSVLATVYRWSSLEPSSRLFGALGVGGSIKALLERPAPCSSA